MRKRQVKQSTGLEAETKDFLTKNMNDEEEDDDGSCVAVLAQNAMIALSYCLNFINEEDVTAIEYCSKKMIETVDIYALSVLQKDSSDDLISQETAIQLRILNMIKNMNCHINDNDIDCYRKQLEQYKMT